MRVEILKSSAMKKCAKGTWFEYWEGHSSKKALKCSVIGCPTASETGAQVIKPSMGNVTFIVPMCSSHAGKNGETMDVMESTSFVLANLKS